ncbi:MAG: putative metalloprotease CJM1_0395 family protein [bacterium]
MSGRILPPQQLPQNFLKSPGKSDNREPAYLNPETQQFDARKKAFDAFEQMKQKKYDKIFGHEAKHKQVGGSQAGAINIEKDVNDVAVEGSVPIQMPEEVDPKNPQRTYEMAKVAHDSALAPPDPSSPDLAIAAKAGTVMTQAQTEVNNKKISRFNFCI